MSKTINGKLGEEYCCKYLEKNGYKILKRNFHSRYGEIDIIAENNDVIAFVEVKTRKNDSLVLAEEAISLSKQRKIILTAECFLENRIEDFIPRFDVITIETSSSDEFNVTDIKHYKGAFTLNRKNALYNF